MSKAEVMDLTVVCQSFPEMPKPEIYRENFLDTIETIFESGIELVVVEGESGIGKTTLLAQFAQRHPDCVLSLFVRSVSRWSCDPEILQFDLCNQIQWTLCQEELSSMAEANDAFLRSGLTELRRRARYLGKTFCLMVDGLDEIQEEDSHIRKLVLDMLPLGFSSFRFLVSGDLEQLSPHLPQGMRRKSYPLSGFTLNQTIEYFEDLSVDRRPLEEIYQICRKMPGYLASVRRILQSGTDVQTLLTNMPDRLDLFEIEWRKVSSQDNRQVTLLAVMAHDRRIRSLAELARLLRLEVKHVQELLQDLGFINVDRENGKVSFVSEAFRRFAANRLRHLKEQVIELVIDDLLREPESSAARMYLPGYLKQAGRLEDILNYLSPEHFPKMLEHCRSLGPVQQQAELGLTTAQELGRDGDLIRFSAHKSTMTELWGAKIWRSEIEAQMALNDYDAAMALAQSTVLDEERLHLLAIVAKARRKQGLAPEPELVEQIHQLYVQIDHTTLGELAVDIASDLLHCSPELAIEMVEKATESDTSENALDWAFAKLSVAALGTDEEQFQIPDTIEILSNVVDQLPWHVSLELTPSAN